MYFKHAYSFAVKSVLFFYLFFFLIVAIFLIEKDVLWTCFREKQRPLQSSEELQHFIQAAFTGSLHVIPLSMKSRYNVLVNNLKNTKT